MNGSKVLASALRLEAVSSELREAKRRRGAATCSVEEADLDRFFNAQPHPTQILPCWKRAILYSEGDWCAGCTAREVDHEEVRRLAPLRGAALRGLLLAARHYRKALEVE